MIPIRPMLSGQEKLLISNPRKYCIDIIAKEAIHMRIMKENTMLQVMEWPPIFTSSRFNETMNPPNSVNSKRKMRQVSDISAATSHLARKIASFDTGCVSMSFHVSERCSTYTRRVVMTTRNNGKKK